jgi:hypothetical protein
MKANFTSGSGSQPRKQFGFFGFELVVGKDTLLMQISDAFKRFQDVVVRLQGADGAVV